MSRKPRLAEDGVSLQPDSWLMYLIQNVTGQKTDEILGFFYDFGREVGRLGVEDMANTRASSIRKDIRDFYPGTSIPFKLLVESSQYYGRYNANTGAYERSGEDPDVELHRISVRVTFPESVQYFDTAKILDVIMEKQLLGGSSLPDFEAPKPRTPKLYKELIEEVCQKRQTK